MVAVTLHSVLSHTINLCTWWYWQLEVGDGVEAPPSHQQEVQVEVEADLQYLTPESDE